MSTYQKITILAGPLGNINSRGLVYPLFLNRSRLLEMGYQMTIGRQGRESDIECDYLLVDSKVFKEVWAHDADLAIEKLSRFKDQANKVVWFNTGDSTSEIQRQVMPYVSMYFKSQLLRDRRQYKEEFYGGRVFTDYFYKKSGIRDQSEIYSQKLSDAEIKKLRLSWNFGLSDCFSMNSSLRIKLCPRWLPRNGRRQSPHIRIDQRQMRRPITLNLRMTANYDRSTVAHQRKLTMKILERYGAHRSRVSSRQYFRELRESQLVVSPFGWGEINIRDFEAISSGAALVKPSMRHLDTYPNVFHDGETYSPYRWDCSDLLDVVDGLVEHPIRQAELAQNALDHYREFLTDEGQVRFVQRFVSSLN